MNRTSPSSSFVQMISALDDRGINSDDLRNKLRLRTFSVMNEIDGSGGKGGLVFPGSPFSSCSSLFDLSLAFLGSNVMVLIEL